VSCLVNGVEYLKPNKNWFVGVFKCLDHGQMAGSRHRSNQLITSSHSFFAAWWMGKKYSWFFYFYLF